MRLIDYYDTTEWEHLKSEVLKRDNGQCQECSSSDNLHVHHTSYPESLYIGDDKYINVEADRIENLIFIYVF